MYLIGQGHEHLGPGTSMVQFLGPQLPGAFNGGLGTVGGVMEFRSDCPSTGGSCSESYGMGCACSGKCKSGCGMGFFDGGLDPSTFGALEWATVIAAGYVMFATAFTTKRAAGRLAAIPGNRRKSKAARYRKMADELTRKKK